MKIAISFLDPLARSRTSSAHVCLRLLFERGHDSRDTRPRQIEVAALAGFGAIELWFSVVDEHLAAGGTLADLRHALDDRGLVVPTMIYLGGWVRCGGFQMAWRKTAGALPTMEFLGISRSLQHDRIG